MSTQLFVNGIGTALGATAAIFACHGNREIAAGGWNETIMPVAGTVRALRVKLRRSPGSGNSRTFTVWNASTGGVWSSSSLAVTISGSSTEGANTVNSVIISAPAGLPLNAERIQLRETVSGVPTNTAIWWSLEWVPATADETILGCNTDTVKLASGTQYLPVFGAVDTAQALSSSFRCYIPTSGTFSDLAVRLSASPHTFFNRSRLFIVRKNGIDTALTVNVRRIDISGVDNVNSFTVVAGDYIDVKQTTVSVPTAAWVSLGMVFKPDNADEFVMGCGAVDGANLPVNTLQRYHQPSVGTGIWQSSIHLAKDLLQEYRVAKMWAFLETLPNAGGTWTLKPQVSSGAAPSIVWDSGSSKLQNTTGTGDWAVDAALPMQVNSNGITNSLPWTKAGVVWGLLITPVPAVSDPMPIPISPHGVIQE